MPVTKIFDRVGSTDPLTGDKKNAKYNPFFVLNTRNKKGVYILFANAQDEQNRKAVYVGHSKTDLYKTIIRHFQDWSAAREKKYEAFPPYLPYLVKIIRMDNKTDADILRAETLNIIRYDPPNNERKTQRAAKVQQAKQDERTEKAEKKAFQDPEYIEQYLKGLDDQTQDIDNFLQDIDEPPF